MTAGIRPKLLFSKRAISFNLPHRALFSLPDSAHCSIACVEGSVWITLDNDPRDVILDATDVFSTQEHRRAIIYALKHSVIDVTVHALEALDTREVLPGLVLQMSPI